MRTIQEAVMKGRFEEVVTTRRRLRELYRPPSHLVSNKDINHIDDICRRFIAACPFVLVASRGADARLDLSPKGDPEGFVVVLDDKTLAIPDRLGMVRSSLWRPKEWPDRGNGPTLAEAMGAHGAPFQS